MPNTPMSQSRRGTPIQSFTQGKKEHVPGSGAFVQYGVSCPFLY